MSKLSLYLTENWSLVTPQQADRWLTAAGLDQKESARIAYLVGGKMSLQSLQMLHARASSERRNLLDAAIEWLKLFAVKKFGVRADSCVVDVTAELPIAGICANGADLVRLTPQLITSAVGIKTISELAGDYLHQTAGLKPIGGNGLLSPPDRATEVVDHATLVDRGYISPRSVPRSTIEVIWHNARHRSHVIWADRIVKYAKIKGHRITREDIAWIASRDNDLAVLVTRQIIPEARK